MSRILVVDDELSMREVLEIYFSQEGHAVRTAADGLAGQALLDAEAFDLVVTDLRMPGAGGLEVLAHAQAHHPTVPVIIMTAFASTETALQAMKAGAYDYFTKPFKLDEISVVIAKALERRRLVTENLQLREALADRRRTGNLIGRSPAMQRVFELIHRIAPTRSNVLILGESGTGKELVARAVHEHSDRAAQPFLVINCAAIPENLLESELFGHKRGTFTGATADKVGLFRAADGGTLFLDEIGELPLTMQVKLLRVLQERKVKAVGDLREVAFDVRVIAATNRDLAAEVQAGSFREDLYYRLNVISLDLPALRERPTDIPLLAQHFLNKFAREFGKLELTEIDPEAMQCLLRHPFSGNVRELENVIERAVALGDGRRITPAALPPQLRDSPQAATPHGPAQGAPADAPPAFGPGYDLDAVLADLEQRLIVAALTETGGRKMEAARLLGISFRSLRYRLKKLDLQDDEG